MSVSVSVIYSLCKLKYYLQVNKTSFVGGEAWHCSSFSRNIFLISATDEDCIVLDGFVILLSFSSNACDLLEIEVSIVFYWVVLLVFFNILQKKLKPYRWVSFPIQSNVQSYILPYAWFKILDVLKMQVTTYVQFFLFTWDLGDVFMNYPLHLSVFTGILCSSFSWWRKCNYSFGTASCQ